jgi:protein-S-isoprenylcysteine O-methyltransferase Ste14
MIMENRLANVPTGRLLSGIVGDAETLVQQQFAMFKEEIKVEMREARQALLPALAGGAVAAIAVLLFCFGMVYLLDWATTLPLWACFVIVAAVLGTGGGIALAVGLQRLRQLTPVADESVEELKENVRWLTKPN